MNDQQEAVGYIVLCVLQGSRNAINAGKGEIGGRKVREDRMIPAILILPLSPLVSL